MLWLVPRLVSQFPEHAERVAELIEMPIMIAVIFLAARWIVRQFPPPSKHSSPRRYTLAVGFLALALLVAAEMILGWKLRDLSPLEYFTASDPVSGTAYFASLLLFALLPSYLNRHQS